MNLQRYLFALFHITFVKTVRFSRLLSLNTACDTRSICTYVRGCRSTIYEEDSKDPLTGHSQPVHPRYSSSYREEDDDWISFTNPRGINKTSISYHHWVPRVPHTPSHVFVCISGFELWYRWNADTGQYLFVVLLNLDFLLILILFSFTSWRGMMIPRGILHRPIYFTCLRSHGPIQFRPNRRYRRTIFIVFRT